MNDGMQLWISPGNFPGEIACAGPWNVADEISNERVLCLFQFPPYFVSSRFNVTVTSCPTTNPPVSSAVLHFRL